MKKADLRGKSRADQYRLAAEFAGVAPSVFEGIARTESANGTKMLSPAGARGWFGIMPDTQKTWESRQGETYDPNDFSDGLVLSALTLRENMKQFGNVEDSLRAYNGSWDRTKWSNAETAAYVGKVLGTDNAGNSAAQGARIASTVLTVDDLRSMSDEDFLNTAPKDMLEAKRTKKMPKQASTEDLVNAALRPGVRAEDVGRGSTVAEADVSRRQGEQEFNTRTDKALSVGDKFKAAFEDQSLTWAIARAINRDHHDTEPGFGNAYAQNWDKIEEFANTEQEAQWMRDANSSGELLDIQQQILQRRQRQGIYARNGADAIAYSLLGNVADPVSMLGGMGIGKVLQMSGVGSRALMAGRAATEAKGASMFVDVAGQGVRAVPEVTGGAAFLDVAGQGVKLGTRIETYGAQVAAVAPRPLAGALSLMGENAGVNVLATAALDAAGEHETTEDYAWAFGTGAILAAVATPFMIHGVKSQELEQFASRMRKESAERNVALYAKAQQNVGSDATSDVINAEVERLNYADIRDQVRASLAAIPEENRFLSEDEALTLTSDPALKADVEKRYDLAAVSDDTERSMVAEMIARSEKMAKDNPIDIKATRTLLSKITGGGARGMESTGLTLLASDSPTARAISMMLLEGTTGASGRRRTAAMSQVVRERLYNEAFSDYDSHYNIYRKERGVNVFSEAWDGRVRSEFGRAVALEVEARNLAPGAVRVSDPPHPAVKRAADSWEKGMDLMRVEQQHVGTVGAARLGTSSIGYFTHKADARAIASLTREQAVRVRGVLSDQFIDPQNGFDRAFSDRLAAKYLETATDKVYGMAPVPMNLHSPEAADIVRDAMKAMGVEAADLERLMGKFSRGGASHTKKRLRLDMNADIGDGKKLIDLFDTDMTGLYRGYARRVSGEVALAQYGVLGKKGLQVLKQAMKADGATPGEIEAFDQIAAEFLNTSFGSHNHKYMDNVRIATSLSRLGGMGFTQMGEFGNGIAAVGVHRVFAAIPAMPRLMKEVGQLKAGGVSKNAILGSLDRLGGQLGMDDYRMTRLFDVRDNDIQMYGTERLGVLTRSLRAAGNLQAIAAGHRIITAVQTRGMAEQIIHKAVAFIRNGAEDIALEDMGFNAQLREAIKMDLPNIAKFDAKGKLVELNLDNSTMKPGQIMEMRDAIERGASQIIQRTYTGETGKWAHDGFLKLLFQFRTFSITSVEKQWGRNVSNYGALKSAMYLAGAMSFALPIHLARVQAKTLGMSRGERDKYIKDNTDVGSMVRATMNYAAASGLAGDIYDIGVGFAGSWAGAQGKEVASKIGARGQGQGKLIGGVFVPGVSMIEDVWAATHGDPHKALKALPGSNLPYVTPLVNWASQEDE